MTDRNVTCINSKDCDTTIGLYLLLYLLFSFWDTKLCFTLVPVFARHSRFEITFNIVLFEKLCYETNVS